MIRLCFRPRPASTPAAIRRISTVPSHTQIIEFQLDAAKSKQSLATASAAAFGLKSLLSLTASRLLQKVGIEVATGFERIKFTPLLLPSWRVSASLLGTAQLEDGNTIDLAFTLNEASISGTSIYPLSHLSTISLWDAKPVDFSNSTHSTVPDSNLPVTIIPFDVSPINLLEKIKNLPTTTIENDKFSLNPKSLKAELFACYPLYIPAYLAEFVETTEEKRRCTAITFATSTAQSFAVFPTFKENPTWAPGGNGDSISITVNGVGVGSNFNSGLLKTLIAPILENLKNKARELGVGDPIKNMELLNSSKNLMSYSENHDQNEVYINAAEQVLNARGALKNFENLPEGSKAIILSREKGIKLVDGEEARQQGELDLKKAKEELELKKPSWMKK